MGLDISHCKATFERPNTTDPNLLGGETKDNFNGFNVPFEHFHKYVKQIECGNILHTVIIVKQENLLEEVKEWFKNYEYSIFIKESEEQLNRQLEKYEINNGLKNLYKYYNENVSGEKWIVLSYYEILKKKGFYYNQIGEQRKGMNGKFWERFCREDISNFALKEDFDFAFSCLDFDEDNETKEDFNLRKLNFKENFIDNFELGASFLSVSY